MTTQTLNPESLLVDAEQTLLAIDPAMMPAEAQKLRGGGELTQRDKIVYYIWVTDQLSGMFDDCACACCTDPEMSITACPRYVVFNAAVDRLDEARRAYAQSDELRPFEVRDDVARWTVTATPATLREAVQQSVREGDWGTRGSWVWHGYALDPITNEDTRIDVDMPATMPACATGKHHVWSAPHEVVGGIQENPGVWGHGGGVVIREVCRYCGRYKVTDTYATDTSNGQPFTAVDFEDADEASLAWVAKRRRKEG